MAVILSGVILFYSPEAFWHFRDNNQFTFQNSFNMGLVLRNSWGVSQSIGGGLCTDFSGESTYLGINAGVFNRFYIINWDLLIKYQKRIAYKQGTIQGDLWTLQGSFFDVAAALTWEIPPGGPRHSKVYCGLGLRF